MTTERRHSSGPGPGDHPSGRRTVIPAMCQLEGCPVAATHLVVSKRDRTIVLDPQVPGSCVMSLDEDEATTLGTQLSLWLG